VDKGFDKLAAAAAGRGLHDVAGALGGRRLRVATAHLESPCGWNQLYSEPRVAQCKQAPALPPPACRCPPCGAGRRCGRWARARAAWSGALSCGAGAPTAAGGAQALAMLDRAGEANAVFCGDMNWGAKEDGEPPLPPGWRAPRRCPRPARAGFHNSAADVKLSCDSFAPVAAVRRML